MALLPGCSPERKCCLKTSSPTLDGVSQQLKQHAEELARAGDRFACLGTPMTTRKGQSKGELAKQIAARTTSPKA